MLVQETSVFDIRNCDCMDLMKEYPDKHFDLALVDPPYGIGFDGEVSSMVLHPNSTKWKNAKLSGYIRKEWDKNKPPEEYFKELFRTSKNQIICGGNHYNLPLSTGWIFWDKQNGNFSLSDGELIWTSFKKGIRKFVFQWHGFIKGEICKRIHPTQKPVALYEWLLTKYAKKGDKILDTHMGSGSSAIACHNLGFDLTACELDKEYYEAALKRINFHTAQKRLF